MMHVFDIWLEQLKVFYPANLKIFVLGIAKQLLITFKFLFVDWWWLSWFFLFSQMFFYLATMSVAALTNSIDVLLSLQIIIFAPQVYFAFLAILSAVPTHAHKSSKYVAARQSLFWPIVTPFVLWIYFNWHIYKFFSLLLSPMIVATFSKYASLALLTNVDWFASPLFVFFAFMIIASYVQHGVWYAIEHAVAVLWYMYPLCVVMFGCLYGLQKLLNYGLKHLALVNPWLLLLFHPLAILIPVAVVLFGAVYRWYIELVYEFD
jgi:hypothetical protein